MNKLIKLFSKRAELINRQYLMGIKVAEKNQSFTATSDCCFKNFSFQIKMTEKKINDLLNIK